MLTLVLRRRAAAFCSAGLLACAGAAAQEAFRFPAPGASFTSGATAEASWTGPCERGDADEAELVLSLDDGITFPIRLTEEMPACASTQRWRVPDVESSRARLGLRRGREGRGDEERIVLVSARFSIVAGARPSGPGPTRGAVEWWTEQALFAFDAEDFLDETLGREPECFAGRAAEDEAEDSDPAAPWQRFEVRGRVGNENAPPRLSSVRMTIRPASALAPLRL